MGLVHVHQGDGTAPSTWTMSGGRGRPAPPSGPEATSVPAPTGKIFVFAESRWTITSDAQKLGADLVIGQTRTGTDSDATVNVATAALGLAGNLKLYNSAEIVVQPRVRAASSGTTAPSTG